MWTFTIDGFFSVVQHKDDAGLLLVRARAREDLVRFRDRLAPTGLTLFIMATPDRDYAYRMVVPRRHWARYLTEVTEHLDYGNFKSEVAVKQGFDRAHLYGEVWATMLQLQEDES